MASWGPAATVWVFSAEIILFACCFVAVLGQCPKPPRLEYAELTDPDSNQDSFSVDTVLTYKCRPGYVRSSGSNVNSVTCLISGTWTAIGEFCQRKSCGSLPEITNGDVNYSDLLFGSVATYTCDVGYNMIGSPTRVCEVDGWSLQSPTCEAVVCNDPPAIQGGVCSSSSNSEATFGTVATCKCLNVEEHLIGEESIHCTSSGAWSEPLPYCKEVHCDNLEVENGYKLSNFLPPYTYRHSISFACNEGFQMVGHSIITCTENNTWVPSPPKCQRLATSGAPPTALTTTSVMSKTESTTSRPTVSKDETKTSPRNVQEDDKGAGTTVSAFIGNIQLVLTILMLNNWMHQ